MRDGERDREDLTQGERSPVAGALAVLVLLVVLAGALALPRYALPVIEEGQEPPAGHYSSLCWACHRAG